MRLEAARRPGAATTGNGSGKVGNGSGKVGIGDGKVGSVVYLGKNAKFEKVHSVPRIIHKSTTT